MAKTKMMNFRTNQGMMDQYTAAAKASGMSRSEWLRNAADLALGRYQSTGSTPKANATEIPTKTGAECEEGDYRKCSSAIWASLPSGIKKCNQCGVKTAGAIVPKSQG
jgi:hypothetical protein